MAEITEEIASYSSDIPITFTYDDNITSVDEIRTLQGFKNKIIFNDPYFYTEDGFPFVEIISYRKNTRNAASIVTLWDHKQGIFEFYCKDEREEFKCVKEFIDFAHKIIGIEKGLLELKRQDNDKYALKVRVLE